MDRDLVMVEESDQLERLDNAFLCAECPDGEMMLLFRVAGYILKMIGGSLRAGRMARAGFAAGQFGWMILSTRVMEMNNLNRSQIL